MATGKGKTIKTQMLSSGNQKEVGMHEEPLTLLMQKRMGCTEPGSNGFGLLDRY
jgi:hypothetical protein